VDSAPGATSTTDDGVELQSHDLVSPLVIMMSGTPWSAAAHRQHALAVELARSRVEPIRVLFVDPPTNGIRWRFEVAEIDDGLWHAVVPAALPFGRQSPVVNLVNRVVAARSLRAWLNGRPGTRVLWLDEDLAHPMVGRLGEAAVVYDATDLDWTFTRRWNRRNLRRSLRRAVVSADQVLVSSAALPGHLPPVTRPPIVVANGCDTDLFEPDGPVPRWMEAIPRPIVGYLGRIDVRAFDGELVADVARRHPEWTFVLVGPSTKAGVAPMAGLANVRIVDEVPFSMAPAIVRGCDVGIIPYRTGGLIDYVHPKKLYEYLAAGKPVVATGLPAVSSLDAPVHVANGPDEFADAISAALATVHSPQHCDERRSAAMANTWTARGDQIRDVIRSVVPA